MPKEGEAFKEIAGQTRSKEPRKIDSSGQVAEAAEKFPC
jgi:hypothetical protein